MAVALANRTARIVWAVTARGDGLKLDFSIRFFRLGEKAYMSAALPRFGRKTGGVRMPEWPDDLFDFTFISNFDARLDALAAMAEPEVWDYQVAAQPRPKPILYNYLRYTYSKLAAEDKIMLSETGQNVVFNTGLVTKNSGTDLCLLRSQSKSGKTTMVPS